MSGGIKINRSFCPVRIVAVRKDICAQSRMDCQLVVSFHAYGNMFYRGNITLMEFSNELFLAYTNIFSPRGITDQRLVPDLFHPSLINTLLVVIVKMHRDSRSLEAITHIYSFLIPADCKN